LALSPPPDHYSPVGGRHRSIDEPDPTAAKQSQAKVGVLHHGKCLVATSHRNEIRTAKEHGLIAEQKTAAPEEQVRSKDQRRVPGLDPIMQCCAPPHPLGSRNQGYEARKGYPRVLHRRAYHCYAVIGQDRVHERFFKSGFSNFARNDLAQKVRLPAKSNVGGFMDVGVGSLADICSAPLGLLGWSNGRVSRPS
jgi:hypothetical protein